MPARVGTAGREIAAVVLAAGSSSRYGSPKQLASYRGAPLITHAVRRAARSTVEQVVVVLGAHHQEVEQVLPLPPRLRVVVNLKHAQGLSTSLGRGLAALSQEVAGAVILLGDVPEVEVEDIDRVAASLRRGAVVARIRYRNGPGHPVGFSRPIWPRLASIDGDVGARSLLRGLPAEEIVTDRPRPRDIDWPRDL